MKSKKREFRQEVLKQQHKTLKQVIVSANELYKDANGLEWKEHNKEVAIKNVYHEVLSIKRQGNSYIVTIIEDKTESELFANFFKKNDSDKGLADHLLLVFAMNFVIPQHEKIRQQTETELRFCTLTTQPHRNGFYSKTIKPPCV
ncbi:MAG: hypothetical protein SGJ15_06465 [Bacteroidota bacterium]|nr:hypothetical protein [Bacteroidota bacterium]